MAEIVKENQATSQNRRHVINRSLVPAKAVQFFKGGGDAVFHKFVPLYLRSVGLTPSESGLIFSAHPFATFLISPMFGAFADKYHKHKSTVVVTGLLSVVIYLCVLTVPAREQPHLNWCFNDSHIYNYVDNGPWLGNQTMTLIYKCLPTVCKYRNASSNIDIGLQLVPYYSPGDYDKCNNMLCEIVDTTELDGVSCLPTSTLSRSNSAMICRNGNRSREHVSQTSNINSGNKVRHIDVSIECPEFICAHNDEIESSYKVFEHTFLLICVIYIIASAFLSPIASLLNTMVYAVLGDNWGAWGRQRLWGSVAGIVSVIGTTVLLDVYSRKEAHAPYSFCFYVFAVEIALCCIFSAMFTLPANISVGNVWKGSLKLFKSFRNIAFFINCTVFGMYVGAISGFTYWYLLELNTSGSVEKKHVIFVPGLLTALDLLFEIPIYYIGGVMLKRLGHIPIMGMIAVMYGIRFTSYTFIRNPWYALLTAPLNPLSFAMFEFTSSSYANLIAPPGLDGVSQSVVGGLHLGLGCGSGTLLTGFLFDQIGGTWTFRVYACSCFCVMTPFIFFQWCLYGKQHVAPSADHATDLNNDENIKFSESVLS